MKICFRCQETLPLSEFYKHPDMADGRLNKCKTCTRTDTAIRVEEKSKDVEWFLKERERQKFKQRRRVKLGLVKPVCGAKRLDALRRARERNPIKYQAVMKVGNAIRDGKLIKQPCEYCGIKKVQAHHPDYSKPLDVRWLCVKHHAQVHVEERISQLKAA